MKNPIRFLLTAACLCLAQCSPILAQAPSKSVTIDPSTNRLQQTTIKLPSGATMTVESGGTLTLSGALSGTPTGGTLNLSNLTLTLPSSFPTSASKLSFFASTTSSELAGVISDENGSGKLLFAAGTISISSGKTLTASNTLTLAGTDGSTLNVGAGGTLGSAAFVTTSSLYGPAFRATRSTDLTLTGGFTLDPFLANTKAFDTDSAYNTSDGKFTPQKAGYYRVHLVGRINGTNGLEAFVRMNGSTYFSARVGDNAGSASVNIVLQFNGSTDYVEALFTQGGAGGETVIGGTQYSWFEAEYVRP